MFPVIVGSGRDGLLPLPFDGLGVLPPTREDAPDSLIGTCPRWLIRKVAVIPWTS